jgi:hypothetical protein
MKKPRRGVTGEEDSLGEGYRTRHAAAQSRCPDLGAAGPATTARDCCRRSLKNPQAETALAARPPPPLGFFSRVRRPAAVPRSEIRTLTGACSMGKGNNAQKNDKKNKKPKQDKTKTPVKK